jgi:hypothetical protein
VPASGTATPSSGRPASPVDSSPPISSPLDISQYLTYASEKLGVHLAWDFISPLKRKSYGLDILSEVLDSDLADLGIPPTLFSSKKVVKDGGRRNRGSASQP